MKIPVIHATADTGEAGGFNLRERGKFTEAAAAAKPHIIHMFI